MKEINQTEIHNDSECGRGGCPCYRPNGNVHCPAHDDTNPSLSVKEVDGKILLKCFAGCSFEEITNALRERGLWGREMVDDDTYTRPYNSVMKQPSKPKIIKEPIPKPTGVTLAEYSMAKQLPIDFLKSCGLYDTDYAGLPAVGIPYFPYKESEPTPLQYRIGLHPPAERFRFAIGDKPTLYGLWRLNEMDNKEVVICEGVSDTQTLWYTDFNAIGLPSANGWNEDRDAKYFEKFKNIYVVIEPDAGGEAVIKWLKQSVIRHKAKLIYFGKHSDPSELWSRNG